MGLWFSRKNISDHTAVLAPILGLRVTVQKLKYKSTLKKKSFSLFSGKLVCSQVIDLVVNSQL